MEIVLIIFPLFLGLIPSIYAGVIVARYMNFDATLNRARSLIFNLEKTWEYRYLEERIDDPDSTSGKRALYMSKTISNNGVSWMLTEIGLQFKETGHWECGLLMDKIGEEIEILSEEFIEKAKLRPNGDSISVEANIADWHRRISSLEPNFWKIIVPAAHSKYKNLACVEIDESTGEFREVEANRPETIFDDPNTNIHLKK